MSVTLQIPSDGKPGIAAGAAARCLARALAALRFRHGAMRSARAAHPDARARLWQSENTSRGWPKPAASRVSNSSARLKRLLLCISEDSAGDALFLSAASKIVMRRRAAKPSVPPGRLFHRAQFAACVRRGLVCPPMDTPRPTGTGPWPEPWLRSAPAGRSRQAGCRARLRSACPRYCAPCVSESRCRARGRSGGRRCAPAPKRRRYAPWILPSHRGRRTWRRR